MFIILVMVQPTLRYPTVNLQNSDVDHTSQQKHYD